MLDLLIGFLVLGPGAFVLAGLAAFLLGPSPWRMLAVALFGIPAAAGLFLLIWLDSSPTEYCHDCGQVLGRWMSPVLVFFLFVNAIAWASGAFIGWAVAVVRRRVPDAERGAGD